MANKIKRAYYYYFYKVYRFIEYTSEMFGGAFWTDFKTVVVMVALEIWFVVSFFNYYNVYLNNVKPLSKTSYIVVAIFFSILNYLIFTHTDKWKEYTKRFDELPKEINKKGSWIVFGITLFIICNLIFSFYLLFQIRKS